METVLTIVGWIVLALFGAALGYARSQSWRDIAERRRARANGEPVPPLGEPQEAVFSLRWGGTTDEDDGS